MNFKKIFFLMLSISVSAPHIKTVQTPQTLQTLASKATIGAILTAMNKKKTWNKELKKISYLGLPLQQLLINELRHPTNDYLPWKIEQGFPHTDAVFSARFSPDWQQVATASRDGTAKIWNAHNGQLQLTLRHTDLVKSAHFSPDGKLLVTTSRDGTAKVWSTVTGELIHTFQEDLDSFIAADFSPDGQEMVTLSRCLTTKVWNAITFKLIHTSEEPARDATPADFSPDGRQITLNGSTATIWSHGFVTPKEATPWQTLLQLLVQTKLYSLKNQGPLELSRLSHLNPIWQTLSPKYQQKLETDYQTLNLTQAIKIPA